MLGRGVIVGPKAHVDSSACVINSVIADDAIVSDKARVSNSMICGSSVICDSATVHNSIVRGNSVISKRGAVMGSTVDSCMVSGLVVCCDMEHSVVTGKTSYQKMQKDREHGIREEKD